MWRVVWRFKLEDKGILLLHGRNNLQTFQRLDPALSLLRFGGLVTKSINIRLHMTNLFLLTDMLLLLNFNNFGTLSLR